jgi:hypothetical protein
MIDYVGLESQIVLIENKDDEIYSQWVYLVQDIYDLSDTANMTLKKMSMIESDSETNLRAPLHGELNEVRQ